MDVIPPDLHGAAPNGPAPRPGSTQGATPFRITLGQMLRLYVEPGTAGPPRPRAPGGAPRTTQDAGRPAPASGRALDLGVVARPLPGQVGSAWGSRVHPVHGDVRMHHGVDIAAPTGTPIRSFAAGTVTFAGSRGGYGNVVIVEHANGLETRYAHQSGVTVVVGQQVAAGDVVGRVGATGTATGPHLHFELRRHGESIDPAAHLP